MENNKEVLLKVEHLCQYFKMGKQEFKAVDDVSFDVYKGEVFGLVGESGCGKTTTGRSIIRLYDITSGDIYFKGRRICAGTRSYKNAIAAKRAEAAAKINDLKLQLKEEGADVEGIKAQINRIDAELSDFIKDQRAQMSKASYDHKNSDKVYAKERVAAIDAEYKAIVEYKSQIEGQIAGLKAQAEAENADKQALQTEIDQLDRELAEYLRKMTAKLKLGDSVVKSTDSVNAANEGSLADLGSAAEEFVLCKKEYKNQRSIAKKSKFITQIQMIFQDPIASLDPRMTVNEIISEGLTIKGIKDKEYINNKVYELLELVGLVREHAGRYPHEFSGGQRQRIGIARSVIMNPEMIIADEPVSALDVSIQAQVINLLNELRNKLGLTILFIAHDLSVVKYFSDRIGVMYYGKLVELATSEELFAHPLHPYTRSLLSAIPLPDPQYEKKRVRLTYNPLASHDYSVNKPTMREVSPGHFVYCNDEEELKYKQELGVVSE